jgi:hypothetical protein
MRSELQGALQDWPIAELLHPVGTSGGIAFQQEKVLVGLAELR